MSDLGWFTESRRRGKDVMKADGEDKVERTDGCRGNDKMEEKKGGDGMNACGEGRGGERGRGGLRNEEKTQEDGSNRADSQAGRRRGRHTSACRETKTTELKTRFSKNAESGR